jgi:pimeloyl-ACP methyl ester carboxylesterase
LDDPNTFGYEPDAAEEANAVIFVHGWSVDYETYNSVAQTMFKRLWWQGFKGRFATLRWDPLVVGTVAEIPTSNGEYNRSENRAWLYGESLRAFGDNLDAQGFQLNLIGHSMGNVVCGSALRKGLRVRNYIMMEAAVPAGCFDTSGGLGVGGVNGYERFWVKEQRIPTPDFEAAPNGPLEKGYRGYLAGIKPNVSRDITNFHNSSDFALATGRKAGLDVSWEANEEDYKPDGRINTPWHYRYRPTQVDVDHRAIQEFFVPQFLASFFRFVTDTHEIKAFVARPRSRAAGAVEGSNDNPEAGGSINRNVNLRTGFGFGTEPSDHSGQFERRCQQVDALYSTISDLVR